MMMTFQLYKMLHLLGLSMMIGGILTTFLVTLRFKGDRGADQGAFVATHLVAAPGLVILMLTGMAQSFLHQFAEFKGAGFMHLKVLLVVVSVVLLAVDIRTQGVMRRSENLTPEIKNQLVGRRKLISGLNVLAAVGIVFLIVWRPF